MGLSHLPMFFVLFAEGPLAGILLTKHRPSDITDRLATVPCMQSPQFMRLILAAMAVAKPILMMVFKTVIRKRSSLERYKQLEAESRL